MRTSAVATLGALAASYVLAGMLLLAAGTQPVIALTRVFVGVIVVAILAVGVAQTVGVGHGSTMLARLQLAAREPEGQGLSALGVALALATGLLASLGMHASAVTETLPDAVLHPALALAVGGVLTAVFARSPLRLAGGVLFAIAGAEVIYSRLDPGLVITGGLATFHLLVAVVSSYFIVAGHVDDRGDERLA
jgi:hypothetical protein